MSEYTAHNILVALLAVNSEETFDMAREIKDDELRSRAVACIIDEIASTDAPLAAHLLGWLPAQEFISLYRDVVNRWVDSDLPAAREWVDSIADEKAKAWSMGPVADKIEMSEGPAAAIEYVRTMTDAEDRNEHIYEIMLRWLDQDWPTAIQYAKRRVGGPYRLAVARATLNDILSKGDDE